MAGSAADLGGKGLVSTLRGGFGRVNDGLTGRVTSVTRVGERNPLAFFASSLATSAVKSFPLLIEDKPLTPKVAKEGATNAKKEP